MPIKKCLNSTIRQHSSDELCQEVPDIVFDIDRARPGRLYALGFISFRLLPRVVLASAHLSPRSASRRCVIDRRGAFCIA